MDIADLVSEWCKALNEHDSDRMANAFVDDLVYRDVPLQVEWTSKEQLKGFMDTWFTAVPDFAVQWNKFFYDGGRAAVEWTWTGTQKGDLPPSFPAYGKSFEADGVSVLEAREGKLVRVTDYWDLGSVLRQLGHGS